MALKDLIKPALPPAADRPAGITCVKYVRGEGKRCRNYLPSGACSLPDELMCTEWLTINRPQPTRDDARSLPVVAETPTLELRAPIRDLFGNPMPEVDPLPPTPKTATPPAAATSQPAIDPAPALDVDQLRGLTSEDIASWKALDVEVCLHSEAYGELWLVPGYTGQLREEITPEHAATVVRVRSVFPGSHVVAFEENAPTSSDARRKGGAE